MHSHDTQPSLKHQTPTFTVSDSIRTNPNRCHKNLLMAEMGEKGQRKLRIIVSYMGYCKNSGSTEGTPDIAVMKYMKIPEKIIIGSFS